MHYSGRLKQYFFKRLSLINSSIQQLWKKCLAETLTIELRSRIVGCQGQIITFDFYFGLCLGQTLYNLTDSMSKSLQSENISIVSGHRLTLLRLTSPYGIWWELLMNYYLTIVEKAAEHPHLEQTSLPRKHKRTNYSILQF